MDINQAAKMIEWLDEERRRDKTVIATLEERLSQQQSVIDNLQRRLNSVESDQTVIRSEIEPGSAPDKDLLDSVRREVRHMIDNVEAKRLTAEREAEKRAELNRDNMLRPIRELEEKIDRLNRQTTEMPVLQQDRDQLRLSVTSLQQRVENLYKKLEEPDRRLAFLEEQRRQDARRISELETEIPETKKQIDSIRPKITLIEDLALRNERRTQEINDSDRERREQIQQFIDQQNLLLQQRDQQVDEIMKKFSNQENQMERNFERFEAWSEAYRNMRSIIEDFQRIGERLERRINEVAEMQRLSEERFRQEWSTWREDDQKRWRQFTLSNDEVWRSHDNDFERFVQKMDDIAVKLQPLDESINRLWQLERARAQLYRERYQSLLLQYDKEFPAELPVSTPNGESGTTNGTVNS